MSSRLTAAEIARMQAFLTELLDREIMGTPSADTRAIQELFWADMMVHLRANPMSSGLEHLDQLARETMDAIPDATLQGTVVALPAPAPVAVSSSAASSSTPSSKGKAPARPKRKAAASTGKSSAKKPRSSAKSKAAKVAAPKSTSPSAQVVPEPPASLTSPSVGTPLADAMGVSSKAPDVVRQAIEAVPRKARDQGKSPCRLAFGWTGRPLWYDPAENPDAYRAHWRFWMAHRRAFWEWAFHAPLEPGSNALANRRKIKLRANQARLAFLSFCIETWGFYGFMERLDKQPQLFWLGGPPGRTADDSASTQNAYAADLAWLYEHDQARYEATLENALDPDSIDAFGYPNMRAFLETTEALSLRVQPKFRLSDTALARIRFDLTSSRDPDDSWAGPKTEEPWLTFLADSHVQTIQAQVVSSLIEGTYKIPTSKPITRVEDRRADNSELDEPDPDSNDEDEDEAKPE